MGERIIIDPVTRIEGHLAIEVEVENGVVKDAWSKGTLFRGIELILQGRDPRDAAIITQRICGVCPAEHMLASVQGLDNAFGAEVPDNGRIIRNLVAGANFVQSAILHFYHLAALDYLDIMAVADYAGNDEGLLEVKRKIVGLVQAGDTAPLTPRYEPDEFCVADPNIVTAAVAHYLQGLETRKRTQEMLAIFGGKMPHHATYVPGGVTVRVTADRISRFKGYLDEITEWVRRVYLNDVLTLGTGPLKPLHDLKVGFGTGNFISYGMFDLGESGDYNNRYLRSGHIAGGELKHIPFDPEKIRENVKYSKYTDECTDRHPSEGKTILDINKEGAYSFIKAPRYDGRSSEAGALARMLVTTAEGKDPGVTLADGTKKTLAQIITPIGVHPSAVARHAARAYECLMVCEGMQQWLLELKPGEPVCNDVAVPKNGKGAGLVEAHRGALGHWVEIENGKIKNYQCVPATIWNANPRDDNGVRGPIEEALVGTPVPDPHNPINLVRVVRSFDP
ncbi:nickel-dependent hydrogenase large subunit [Candidatus Oleimmundimicrobium sp.]|uniref:nickel-dependent hydrogenase large subunit n=1 Tax=Candidatus Oleimmundimicrobium sp. TaxID=3060597 RepID=UPI0027206AE5|nr:nickel-dependent hydrogenase large subunit [Candidatus Oleimmundimicrobium sp.]MDO8886326.1 nickel-dependent hydrogenase large subunit [Candidatus Oleimmundimicrobium sp.]